MAKRVDSWQVVCSLPRWLLPQDTNSLRLWSCNFSLTQRRWKMMKMLSLISVYNPSTIYIYTSIYTNILYSIRDFWGRPRVQRTRTKPCIHATHKVHPQRCSCKRRHPGAESVVILSLCSCASRACQHVEPLSRRLLLALCLAQKWLWLVQDPKKLLFSRKNEKTAVSQFRKPTAMSMMWSPMSPLSRGVRWIKAPNAVAWKFGIRNAWSPLPDTDEPTMKR